MAGFALRFWQFHSKQMFFSQPN